ncbi:MAG TPA: TIGR01459 family HAD-type hydrolase [Hyphomicrobiaceae bacterium]|nr:TIGR01459 family HAD-type hydrolase [Hyphomicrobiaceae bacterium]
MTSRSPALIEHFSEIAGRYDVLLCDVWGVVHDGKRAFDAANDALTRFRAKGGTVVLVSNAPMPGDAVAALLDRLGVLRSAWDEIVTSGDISLRYISERGYRRVYGIGPLPRDASFFDRLPGRVTDIAAADCVACTGLVDDRRETAETYRPLLESALGRRVPFVCANPDLAVHVGHDLLPCAGAIADLYEKMGGPVVWAGKPHASAYQTGLDVAQRIRGSTIDKRRVLGIGDAVRTDLASAAGADVDGLFIASGLHRDDVMRAGRVDVAAARRLLDEANMTAIGVMAALKW